MSETKTESVRFAQNGSVSLAYQDLGGAGGEPLLLVMGLGMSRFWWPLGFVAALKAEGFHVVVFDQRDAGESTYCQAQTPRANPFRALFRKKAPAYRAEEMADDAVAVLDAVGWRSAHLFGASMGGLLVQRIALRHPDRVRSITSFAAVPSDAGGLSLLRYLKPGILLKLARMKHPEGPDGDAAAAMEVAKNLSSPRFDFDQEAVAARIAEERRRGISGVRDTEAQSRQIGASWSSGKLAELRLPTLVIHGSADQILRPAAGRDTAAAIQGARFVMIDGLGHELPRELWSRIADEVGQNADLSDSLRRWPRAASQFSLRGLLGF